MKEFLSQRGVSWTEKYVDEDRAAAIEMIRRSGQRGVPVTVIGDEVVVGFDRRKLESILAAREASSSQPPKRRSLGAKVADASKFAMPGGTAVQGAYIGGVNPGSPAEAAGLKTGDVIVAVGDKGISSVDDLAKAISDLSGATVKLLVARGPNTRDVVVQLS